jgi:hypothetical protein
MNHHFAADHEYLSPTSSFQQQQMTRRYGSPAGNLSTIVNGLQHNNGGGTSVRPLFQMLIFIFIARIEY